MAKDEKKNQQNNTAATDVDNISVITRNNNVPSVESLDRKSVV